MESQSLPPKRHSSEESEDEILYPTGIASEASDVEAVEPKQNAMPSKPSSIFFISKKVESLDYTTLINKLVIEKDKTKTFQSNMRSNFLRIIYFLITGAVTAIIGVYMETGVTKIGNLKYKFLSNFMLGRYNGPVEEVMLAMFVWYLGVIIPVMIGSCLVVFIAPFASGGGVAQCIGYLNGIRVTNVLSMKGLVVKINSTICTVTSGIAGGKEGPLMHIGAMVGGALPSLLPSQGLKVDRERRDLAAAGFGAGIAVAFGAPLGGLMLSMEEGVSFWRMSLMWRAYLSCLMAYFVIMLFLSIIEGIPGSLNNTELLAFGTITEDVTHYEFFELILFAMQGVIGGVLGASIVKIHTYTTKFRRRFIVTKVRKLAEAFMLAFIVATFSWASIMLIRSCSVESSPIPHGAKRNHYQLFCPDGQYSDISVVFMQTQNGLIHSMLSTDQIKWETLLLFTVLYYIMVNMTIGVSISAGLFVPQIVLGAVWGRLFGTVVNIISSDASWARPAKYAYIGATAQLSGTVGKTFSIMLIMIEASGNIAFSIPLMLVVTITKYVETFFVLPIYETQLLQMGLPFLMSQPPLLPAGIPTSQVMSPPPLVTLPINPTVQTILHTLQTTPHNGFPVVTKPHTSRGLILRQQLLIMLKFKAYKYPTPSTSKQLCQCYDLHLKYARKNINLEKIEVKTKYYNTTLDLTPYYNPYPYTVNQSMPLSNTYFLFRSVGLRHIIVVDGNNEPVAMITRKDLAKFHTWEHLCRSGVKEMIIK